MKNSEKDSHTKASSVRRRYRAKSPFHAIDAAHTIVRVAESLDWQMGNISAFLKTAQHVEYGLSAEIELAAILRWLGSCCLIHRMSEDSFSDDSNEHQVPDLLAAFRSEDRVLATLIEVKTTTDPILTLKADYLARLRAYAALLGRPLLIGWKCRALGIWLLFQPEAAGEVKGEFVEFTLNAAVKADLMSLIAGDFYVAPLAGAGLRLEMKRTSEKILTKDGFQATFQIQKAYFHDAAGKVEPTLPQAIQWTILAAMEGNEDVGDDRVIQSFITTGSMTRAQNILRTALAFQATDDERIHWKGVARDLDTILRCGDILRECRARFGTFIQYVFLQQPSEMPAFIPKSWRSASEPN